MYRIGNEVFYTLKELDKVLDEKSAELKERGITRSSSYLCTLSVACTNGKLRHVEQTGGVRGKKQFLVTAKDAIEFLESKMPTFTLVEVK